MPVAESSLEPPNLSEVVRLLNNLSNRIDDALKGVVTRYEYSSDRVGIDLKFNRSEEIHIELKTLIIEVRSEAARDLADVKSDAAKDVSALESKFESYVAAQAENKNKVTLLIVGAMLTGVSGLVLSVFNRLIIGG